MVIQRIQTLWLLIATGLMIVIGLRPFSWLGTTPVYVNNFLPLSILTWLIVIMLVITIFTFKNLKLQKTIALLSIFLMVALAITGFVYQAQLMPQAVPEWGGGGLFLCLAALCVAFAYRGMSRDQKKLRNSDRLWS